MFTSEWCTVVQEITLGYFGYSAVFWVATLCSPSSMDKASPAQTGRALSSMRTFNILVHQRSPIQGKVLAESVTLTIILHLPFL